MVWDIIIKTIGCRCPPPKKKKTTATQSYDGVFALLWKKSPDLMHLDIPITPLMKRILKERTWQGNGGNVKQKSAISFVLTFVYIMLPLDLPLIMGSRY